MKIGFFLLLFNLISIHVLSAQDELATIDNQSFQSWNAIQIQYNQTERLNLDLEAEFRFKTVGETYNMSFFEVQAQYNLKPFLDVGAGYRNSDRLDDVGKKQGHEKYDRFFGFTQLKTQLNRFDLIFRVLHQIKTQRLVTIDPKNNRRWRYKLSTRYNIPNWGMDPRLSIEFFMLDEIYSAEAYDKFRLSFGSKKEFSKASAFSFKYMFEKEVGITQPASYHILSIRYEYTFKSKGVQ
ncbi:MAG: DUF2490 domain-containing protein [Bacteroidota bacterium]|nr:DUF2490 domain-containing protein [Bacteroidota bacterium]MEC8238898.1 DUF2490 domain-containing protein [Bacteroidota bacterium]